jgi:fatty acid desaturase
MESTTLRYSHLPTIIQTKSLSRVLFDIAKTGLWMVILLAGFVRYPNFWVGLFVAVLVGVGQYHLNILAHDGLHLSLASRKSVNDFLTRWVLLAPQLVPLSAIRHNHLNHHKKLGQLDDLDRQYYAWADRAYRQRFGLWVIGAFGGAMVFPILRKLLTIGSGKQSRRSTTPTVTSSPKTLVTPEDMIAIGVVQGLIVVAFGLWTPSVWLYLVLWVLPLFTVMTGLNSLRSCLEHIQLIDEGDRLASFVSNPIERFFLAPFNMNYHAEHHSFMTVPYYRLPALRQYLQANQGFGQHWLVKSYWEKISTIWSQLR